MVEIVAAHGVRVEVDAPQVDHPGQLGGVADDNLLGGSARRKAEHRRLDPRRAVRGRSLLEEGLPLGALDKALERHRALGDAPHGALGDGQVVVEQVALGVPGKREEDLVRVGDLDLAARYQLDLAPADHRGGGGRHNRADVAIGRLIEVDDHRRVVAGPAALARLAVDPGRPHPCRHDVAGQDQVDPHAEVLVEHARAVVPIGEDTRSRPVLADHVVEAVSGQIGQRRPFGRRDMGLAAVGGGIEDVGVGGRDIHVPADHPRRGIGLKQPVEGAQPGELVLVVVGVGDAAVGHVNRVHADPAAGGRDRACLLVREARSTGNPDFDVIEAHPGQDRHPIPLGLAVVRDLVPASAQGGAQRIHERLVGELGLLKADHVRSPFVEPGQQSGYPLLDRVHVPGRNAHLCMMAHGGFEGWPLGHSWRPGSACRSRGTQPMRVEGYRAIRAAGDFPVPRRKD